TKGRETRAPPQVGKSRQNQEGEGRVVSLLRRIRPDLRLVDEGSVSQTRRRVDELRSCSPRACCRIRAGQCAGGDRRWRRAWGRRRRRRRRRTWWGRRRE